MKPLLNIFNIIGGLLVGTGILALVIGAGSLLSPQASQPAPLLIERVMDIQREVGCQMIDGVIGRETTRLVNVQTEKDKLLFFSPRAEVYMTSSGAPLGSECPNTYFEDK